MINVPSKTALPLSKNTVASVNKKIGYPLTKESIMSVNLTVNRRSQDNAARNVTRNAAATADIRPLNHTREVVSRSARIPPIASIPSIVPNTPNESNVPIPANRLALPDMRLPVLKNPLRKGQKTSLNIPGGADNVIKVCFGWNLKDVRCDMDASAFLVNSSMRVPGDEWFVFYGQTESPDRSVSFGVDRAQTDREIITVNMGRLNPEIQRIVFVLTLNEAFEHGLNFSMVKDAYVRLLDGKTNQEIVSFRLEEYYENVISMTIGEIYLHNGQWKFNPVGNGVQQDLAGQCAIYGVQIG